MITLNNTARFLWERLEKASSTQELKAALMEAFDVSEEQAQRDVDAFVEKLSQNNFLE